MSDRLIGPMRRATHYRDNLEERRRERRQRLRQQARAIQATAPEEGDPESWTDVEIVDELPEEDESLLGRQLMVISEEEDARPVTVELQQELDGELVWREVGQRERWQATYLQSFGSAGSGTGQFQPGTVYGVAVSPVDDTVYVSSGTDGTHDKIEKFSANGTYQSTIATVGNGNGQVNDPAGLAFDLAGQLFVADSGNHRVQFFSVAGAYAGQFGSVGSGDGQFNGPRAVAFNGLDSVSVIVSDSGNNRAQRWLKSGGVYGYFTAYAAFTAPSGVAARAQAGAATRWIAADTGANRIVDFVFNSINFTIGSAGAGNGQFNTPTGIALDAGGNIYVTDTGNNRVQVFNPDGIFVGKFGDEVGEGQLSGPTGIAISDQYIYVADAGNDRVTIWRNPLADRPKVPGLHIPFVSFPLGGGAASYDWTNQPAAATEIFGSSGGFRRFADLSNASQVQVGAQISVAGAAASELYLRYSTDGGSTWNDLTTGRAEALSMASTGVVAGEWGDIVPGAKTDVLLTPYGIDGNATADPRILQFYANFRA